MAEMSVTYMYSLSLWLKFICVLGNKSHAIWHLYSTSNYFHTQLKGKAMLPATLGFVMSLITNWSWIWKVTIYILILIKWIRNDYILIWPQWWNLSLHYLADYSSFTCTVITMHNILQYKVWDSPHSHGKKIKPGLQKILVATSRDPLLGNSKLNLAQINAAFSMTCNQQKLQTDSVSLCLT